MPMWLKSFCVVLCTLLFSASVSFAALTASDSFDYSVPGSLNGQSGGTGFGGNAWTAVSGQGNPALASGSLTYTDGTRTLIVAGNKLQPGTTNRSYRNFSSTITTANQTMWVSFRANNTGTGTLPSNHAGFHLYAGTGGTGTYIFMGKPGFGATNWGMDHNGNWTQKSGGVTSGDRDALLVYKLVFTSSQLTISMWVDPQLDEGSLGTAHATVTGSHSTNIASMNISLGSNAANYQFDEFRFGTTFNDVAPAGQLIAYDGFNYTGNLNGQNGGTGFGGIAWAAVSGQGNPALASGSLTYTDGTNNLATAGNKVQPGTTTRSYRNFPSVIGTSGQTLWVSFRANQTGSGTLPSNHAGFHLYASSGGTGTYIFMGKPGFGATNWGMDHNGNWVQRSGTVDSTGGRNAFLVYKLVFTGSNLTISMWVNPALNESSLGTAQATVSGSHSTSIASMNISLGGNAANYQFDEFRLGTTFTDVAPTGSGGGGGTTHNPANAAALHTALTNAALGDTIILNAGTVYEGTFTLPNKTTGSGYITIQSSNLSSLPASGTRVNLSHASNMPRLRAADAFGPAILAAPSSHHYKLIGLEVTGPTVNTQPDGVSNISYAPIELGTSGTAQDTLAEVPNNIIIDRCIVRANSNLQRIKRGIGLNSASTDVTNCYISDFKTIGQDSQAIGGYNGPGPYNIINNFLEGSTENVLFGGSDPTIANLVPTDIVFKKNHVYKPVAWKTTSPAWLVKNIFELKNARNVLIEGNIFENCWVHGQTGDAIVLTPRNQDGTAPWCVVENVTFTKNIIRNAAEAVNMIAFDDAHPSEQTNNITFEHNLFYNIGGSQWGGGGKWFKIPGGNIDTLTINHNTAFMSSLIASTDTTPNPNFTFTNNIAPHANYGFHSPTHTLNEATLDQYYPSAVWAKNVIQGASSSSFLPNYHGGWNPTSLGYPSTWGTVLVNQGTPGSNFAGWKVITSSAYDNGATDGLDVGVDIDALNAATSGCISGVW